MHAGACQLQRLLLVVSSFDRKALCLHHCKGEFGCLQHRVSEFVHACNAKTYYITMPADICLYGYHGVICLSAIFEAVEVGQLGRALAKVKPVTEGRSACFESSSAASASVSIFKSACKALSYSVSSMLCIHGGEDACSKSGKSSHANLVKASRS